jgi:hypothetical protein
LSISFDSDGDDVGVRRVYDPVGFCIYCGANDGPLTDEHPIPDGLGGRHILPKSSCKVCQKVINEEVEQYCLRTFLGLPRAAYKIQSSKKKPRPSPSVRVRRADGSIERVQLEDEIFPLIFMPVWPPPSVLQGKPAPAKVMGAQWTIHPNEWLTHLGADAVFSETIQPDRFARFLAKIAHSVGIAVFGPGFFKPVLPDFILGRKKRYFEFVGGSLEVRPAESDSAILTSFWPYERKPDGRTLVVAHIRLFPLLGAPDYVIVLGEQLTPWPQEQTRPHGRP